MLEIAKIIDRKLQYPCLCKFTSCHREKQSVRPDLQAYGELELDYSDMDEFSCENVDASDYLEVLASEGDSYTVFCMFH